MRILAAAAAFCAPLVGQAGAQPPATVEPGVIEKEFAKPRAPLSVGAGLPALNASPEAPPGSDSIRFVLNGLQFSGATILNRERLDAIAAPFSGKEISVADLYRIAAEVTRAYSELGYALCVAFVPEQRIEDGVVRIDIVEGYVGEIEIAGNPGKARELLLQHGAKLKRERPLKAATLERYLLLANDIPGVNVRAIFDQGAGATGGAKLILDAKPWRFDAAAGVNNRGSRALGRFRGIVSLAENGNFSGRERIGVDIVQSFEASELTYVQARANYRLNAEGTDLSLTGTVTESEPGTALLSALGFNSSGWTLAAEIEHPLIRSRALNLRLNGSFEVKELKSAFDVFPNSDDSLRIFRAGARVDWKDGSEALTRAAAIVSKGVDLFGSTREGDLNISRSDGSGQYFSAYGEASRLQPIIGGLEAYVAGGAQVASRPLLASEECGYGGGSFGRAFDNFEISGEDCIFGLVELRFTKALGSAKSRAQPFIYYDAGSVWQKGSLLPGELRRETGQSIGGGVRFWIGDHLYADVEYAQPLTRDVALEGDDNGRIFFSIWAAR